MFREKVFVEKKTENPMANLGVTNGDPALWDRRGPYYKVRVLKPHNFGYGNGAVRPGDVIDHAHINLVVLCKGHGLIEIIGESTAPVGDLSKATITRGDFPVNMPTDSAKARRLAGRILRKAADELTEDQIRKAFK